jgi:AraC-like DNA-binding protein
MGGHHDVASVKLAAPSVATEPSASDPLSDVLRMVKLTGALFFLVDASSPWGVRVPSASAFAPIILPRARHVVSYHIVIEGSGWAGVPGVAPVRFTAGDVLVFPHGDPYAMLSAPDGPAALEGEESLDFFRAMAAGHCLRGSGRRRRRRRRFVCGFLGCDARPFNPLLATLPRLITCAPPVRDSLLDRLIELTLTEAPLRRLGGESIRLRLSELIFVEVVRRYLEALPADQTGWVAGLRDPGISRVLALLHERPAHPWTLEELAARSGMSRSVLAERFMRLVGQPPMQYLVRWRVQVAARLLADGATKVAAVALEVGYESEAAFSRSFKKIAGVSPAAWRARFS